MTTATHQTSTRFRGKGLFLETSAQIDRFLACRAIKKEIGSLCAKFDQIGTSTFVAVEFEEVIGKFMRAAQEALSRLPGRHKHRKFTEIWLEVQHALPFYYRGKSLSTAFGLHMADRHATKPITVDYLIETIGSQWENIQAAFYKIGKFDMRRRQTVFDGTTCCLWTRTRERTCIHPKPQVRCRLSETCWTNRLLFESSVRMLSKKRVSEKKALGSALEKLVGCQDSFEYLSTVAEDPNAFGDILIFFEVPDGWSLLTKDRAFRFLNEHHGSRLEVLMVRFPRESHVHSCKVRTESGQVADGTFHVQNVSPHGLLVDGTKPLGPVGTKVAVFLKGEWYQGSIAREETPGAPHPQTYVYGIKSRRTLRHL